MHFLTLKERVVLTSSILSLKFTDVMAPSSISIFQLRVTEVGVVDSSTVHNWSKPLVLPTSNFPSENSMQPGGGGRGGR